MFDPYVSLTTIIEAAERSKAEWEKLLSFFEPRGGAPRMVRDGKWETAEEATARIRALIAKEDDTIRNVTEWRDTLVR